MVNATTANRQYVRSLGKNVGLDHLLRDLEPDLIVSRGLTVGGKKPQRIRGVEDIAAQALDFILFNKVMPTAGVSQPLSDSGRDNRTRDSIGKANAIISTRIDKRSNTDSKDQRSRFVKVRRNKGFVNSRTSNALQKTPARLDVRETFNGLGDIL